MDYRSEHISCPADKICKHSPTMNATPSKSELFLSVPPGKSVNCLGRITQTREASQHAALTHSCCSVTDTILFFDFTDNNFSRTSIFS
eukprot:CCRYP_008973-RC/>CCRYP_008973-RC protein AED:0.47 eAED:1.00 QI:0/0/0/1/0/0/2/0/87